MVNTCKLTHKTKLVKSPLVAVTAERAEGIVVGGQLSVAWVGNVESALVVIAVIVPILTRHVSDDNILVLETCLREQNTGPPLAGADAGDVVLVVAREVVTCAIIEPEVLAVPTPVPVGASVEASIRPLLWHT